LSDLITIVEVGPRDGLQNEAVFIPTKMKLEFISRLVNAGLSRIEVTSFVSPRWVPQTCDAAEVVSGLSLDGKVDYSALVPNQQGFDQAVSLGLKHLAFFTAASETFSQKNVSCSIESSLSQIKHLVQQAKDLGVHSRVYISCVYHCPYEGVIKPAAVIDIIEQLQMMQVDEIALGDTTGQATSAMIKSLFQSMGALLHDNSIAVHFHDTEKNALDNLQVALDSGIQTIDASAGGLGGCPYAPGASGNVATEKVVELLHHMGFHTGVNTDLVREAFVPIFNFISDNAS
jgi:hydroxymethylglutaryl-CoA lyase